MSLGRRRTARGAAPRGGVRQAAWRAAALVVQAAVLAGCHASAPAPAPLPPFAEAARAWPAALAEGRMAFTFRQYARADSVFAAIQGAYPESGAAAEAAYWRAVLRLDPGNSTPATPADSAAALAGLDAYRATDPPREHFAEAGVLRALAARVDSLRLALAYERSAAAAAATAAATTRAALVPRDSLRVRDEALEQARADAAAARAELERVRRRLAAPGRRARPAS